MAVPYEKSIETLEDVVMRTDRAHLCGGENYGGNKDCFDIFDLIHYRRNL